MRRISENHGEPAVIAVDYGASGRSTGTFADLARLLTTRQSVWLTDPPPTRTGTAIVAQWTRESAVASGQVSAVLGFCTGAVYAAALAEQIGATQPSTPALLLLDPEPADDQLVLDQFERVVRGKLEPALPEPQRDAVIESARALRGEHHGTALARALADLLAPVAGPGLIGLGMGERMAQDLLDTIGGYLHYLGGAAELDVAERWRGADAISSISNDTGLALLAPADRSAAVGQETTVDVGYADLLRSPETAQLVDQWLARTASVVAA